MAKVTILISDHPRSKEKLTKYHADIKNKNVNELNEFKGELEISLAEERRKIITECTALDENIGNKNVNYNTMHEADLKKYLILVRDKNVLMKLYTCYCEIAGLKIPKEKERIHNLTDAKLQFESLTKEKQGIVQSLNSKKQSCSDLLNEIVLKSKLTAELEVSGSAIDNFRTEFNPKINNIDASLKTLDETALQLKAISDSLDKAQILTGLIQEYKNTKRSDFFMLFSSTKQQKGARLETAYLKLPIHLRGRVFDNLETIEGLLEPDVISQ